MKFQAAGFSVKGIRELNEDSIILSTLTNELANPFSEFFIEGTEKDLPCFFAIADGMGGQGSGEVASNFVVKKLVESTKNINEFNEETLTTLINSIHKEVKNQNPKMGSTLSGIIVQNGNCGIVNLGDSRTYRCRNSMFLQMTNDDSLKSFVKEAPSNIILNGIGGGLKQITVNCRFSDKLIIAGDRFLSCSDGVHGFVSKEKIEELMNSSFNIKEIVTKIVQEAISAGSDDNCSAVIVEFSK